MNTITPEMLPLGAGALVAGVLAVLAAAVAVLARRIVRSRMTWPMRAGAQDNCRRALLVFAHPDDEVMFFVPTLKALANAGWEVRFMCFTNGGGGGDGSVRSRELLKSAALFGIDEAGVEIVDRRELPDSMTGRWNAELVKGMVATAVAYHHVHMVITFDAGGVSGHPNHIDTHRGVAAYARQSNAVPCYELETVPLARKFTSALDALASAATTPAVSGGAWPASVMVTHNNPGVNDAAMRAHASQYVWFRKLFVYFSRYTFVNTLRRMTPQRP